MIFWNIELWERAYIDLWSIPHFLFGIIGFYILYKAGFKKITSFALVFLFAVLWEMFEFFTPVQEYFTNIVTDVVLALLGFIFIIFVRKFWKSSDNKLFKYSIYLFVISCALGYLASFIRMLS